MTTPKKYICQTCRHKYPFDIGCPAFPDGIPNDILINAKHRRIHPKQKGKWTYEKGTPGEQ